MTDISELSTDDTVSVKDGWFEASILGIDKENEQALVFAPIGTVDTPSGAVPVDIGDIEVIEE